MMNDQVICIIFSVLLVPVNFLCAFWLFQEALQLTGMTYQEYFKKTPSDGEVLLGSEQRWGYTNRFFKAYSSDPERSMHFMKIYAAALLPSVAATLLLCYAEAHAERLSGVWSGCKPDRPGDGECSARKSSDRAHGRRQHVYRQLGWGVLPCADPKQRHNLCVLARFPAGSQCDSGRYRVSAR